MAVEGSLQCYIKTGMAVEGEPFPSDVYFVWSGRILLASSSLWPSLDGPPVEDLEGYHLSS